DDLTDRLLKGLKPEHILLAWSGREVVGCLGLWDQRAYRQRVIKGYSRRLGAVRRLWNLWGQPKLPCPDTTLGLLFLAMPCVRENDPEVFESLLHEAFRRCDSSLHAVMLGLHERDPLLERARLQPHRLYLSRLYLVYWPDGEKAVRKLDDRIPYLEAGGL
ncbi:MAG: hypothetical protein AAF492_28185, partial [Verrucomicrobiota bacterium]